MDFFAEGNIEILLRRFKQAALQAASIRDIPEENVHISDGDFIAAIEEANKEISNIKLRSPSQTLSVGKIAGALAFWLSRFRPLTVAPLPKDDLRDTGKLCDLAIMILVIENLIRYHPPLHILAETVYLLRTGRFTPQSLGLMFEVFMEMGGVKHGTEFTERIR